MRTPKQHPLLPLFKQFIKTCETGKRLQKNGKRIRQQSIEQYTFLYQYLEDFSKKSKQELRIYNNKQLNTREQEREKKYWKRFYLQFSEYLYEDCQCYDNFVGSQIKLFRSFFNYLAEEKGIETGTIHRHFYVRKEQIPIIILKPEQVHFLIYDQAFEQSLGLRLQRVKDIFVIGCTVALRYSDLMSLSRQNLECYSNNEYLVTRSIKTGISTRIKLPDYALSIFSKYAQNNHLLPRISKTNLNKYIKELIERAQWTDPFIKTREKRGKAEIIYKDKLTSQHFRFCDLVTTHTMRRTAITTMLLLGIDELMVRKISGHSAGSKDFFRYVELVQGYTDQQTSVYFERLKQLNTSAQRV